MSHQQHSDRSTLISTDLVLSLANELSLIGKNPEYLVNQLHLPFKYQDIISRKTTFISPYQFVLIFKQFIIPISEQALAEVNYPPMTMPEISMLCYCVINCRNLQEVIERAAEFCTMLGKRCSDLSIRIKDKNCTFSMETVRRPDSPYALLTDLIGLSFFHRLFSWLIGEEIPIDGFDVKYDDSIFEKAICEQIYGHTIHFNRPTNGFKLPSSYLRKPVIRNYQQLVELIDLFPVDIFSWQKKGEKISEAVEHLISDRIRNSEPIPTFSQFSNFFNLSESTFRRRLMEENTSFIQVREKCQKEFAEEALKTDRNVKISELSSILGFHDTSTFRRAFIRWTGTTPSQFKENAA